MRNQSYIGYIPPQSYAFTSMSEALAHFICALCSLECARLIQYIETHPSSKDTNLSRFLPAYTLASWAKGDIDEGVWRNREDGAKDALQRWAVAMIELNTLFRDKGIDDPVKFVAEDKNLVYRIPGRFGWEPNLERIEEVLKIEIKSFDMTPYLTNK